MINNLLFLEHTTVDAEERWSVSHPVCVADKGRGPDSCSERKCLAAGRAITDHGLLGLL